MVRAGDQESGLLNSIPGSATHFWRATHPSQCLFPQLPHRGAERFNICQASWRASVTEKHQYSPQELSCLGFRLPVILTLSPLLLSFQKGWMKSQDPSLPIASSVTRMAFFSSRAGRRLFTVRYLLLFMWRSWKAKTQ